MKEWIGRIAGLIVLALIVGFLIMKDTCKKSDSDFCKGVRRGIGQ